MYNNSEIMTIDTTTSTSHSTNNCPIDAAAAFSSLSPTQSTERPREDETASSENESKIADFVASHPDLFDFWTPRRL